MQSFLVPNFSNHGIESYGFRVLCGTSGEVESLLSEEIFFFLQALSRSEFGFCFVCVESALTSSLRR